MHDSTKTPNHSRSAAFDPGRRKFMRNVATGAAFAASVRWFDQVVAAADELRASGRACILLWMQGGPSQFETFDPKPGRSSGGETKAISTNVPGIHFAENLPEMAKVADRFCVIRSMTGREGSHPRAQSLMHTGYLPGGGVRYPTLGSHVAQHLEVDHQELPGFVRIGKVRGGPDAGFLGVQYDPLTVVDPRQPPSNTSLPVYEARYMNRLQLLDRLQESFANNGGALEVANNRSLTASAAKMIRSSQMEAFRIEQEPASNLQAYGDSDFGRGCLLARRLVESGVPFVEVQLDGWDTHFDNFEKVSDLCSQMDTPVAALIKDLEARGMLEKTLVLWMGEFGRTPKINARAGRDHFPKAFSLAMAGAGVQGGQVIGATDADGQQIIDTPVEVPDLFRTVFHALQINPDLENIAAGRPIKLANEGHLVQKVFGA